MKKNKIKTTSSNNNNRKCQNIKTWNLCGCKLDVFEVHEISIKCLLVIRSACLLLLLSSKTEKENGKIVGKIKIL